MKFRFGMVGGGNGAFIGDVHRHGAQMDDLAILVAGCFTRDMEKNQEAAERWNITDPSRIYNNYAEMAEKESAREDGIDFVSIATPNDTHFKIAKCFLEHGIHVMCDKPLAFHSWQGKELAALAEEKGLLFGVTYTYSGYAMIRQAQEMIENGAIGKIISIQGEYPEEWLALAVRTPDAEQSIWRLDPSRTGPSSTCADIGTHVEYLIRKMTKLNPKRVIARFDRIPDRLDLETHVQVLLDYEGGIPGMIFATQVVVGYECDIAVRIFGDQGSISWTHTKPWELKYFRLGEPPQIYTNGQDYLYPAAKELCRLPAGHKEGGYEAFGNIYLGFLKNLTALKTGTNPGSFRYPTVHDGVKGIQFVEACIESNTNGNVWVTVAD